MTVTFYRTALNTKGQPYEASLMSVELPAGMSREQGLHYAEEQFQKKMEVKHWQEIAHKYEFS